MCQATRQSVLFEGVLEKPVVAQFDAGGLSSDGGLILLAKLDCEIGLTQALCSELTDHRDASKVQHGYLEMLRQRTYGIALGYPDCNDVARLRSDPLFSPLCSGNLKHDQGLASQPSLSRFENAIKTRDVIHMGRRLECFVLDRLKRGHRKAKLITIDLDPTDDPTHGQQAFSFFNGHYDCWCFLPAVAFISIDDDPEQHLFYARLRPGNASASRCSPLMLRRTVSQIRRRWPKAKICVRLDGGFATPQVFQTLQDLRVRYLVGMAGNSVLSAHSAPQLRTARKLAKRAGEPVQIFGECIYQARSWKVERRVIFKAEVVSVDGRKPKDNVRYVVTNLRNSPEHVYDLYRQRGDAENRIKELHHGLDFDRTSCESYVANQLRILQTAAAYVLFQELRALSANKELASASVETLRIQLLKVAVRVVKSARRVVLSMAEHFPWKDLWCRTSLRVGAQPV